MDFEWLREMILLKSDAPSEKWRWTVSRSKGNRVQLDKKIRRRRLRRRRIFKYIHERYGIFE